MGIEQTGMGGKKPTWLVLVGIALLLLIVILASGCAAVDTGVIKDKVRQAGSSEFECKNKTTGTGKNKKTTRSCEFETNPDVCRFHLEDSSGTRGWLEVDCANEYDAYQVGEQYPRV